MGEADDSDEKATIAHRHPALDGYPGRPLERDNQKPISDEDCERWPALKALRNAPVDQMPLPAKARQALDDIDTAERLGIRHRLLSTEEFFARLKRSRGSRRLKRRVGVHCARNVPQSYLRRAKRWWHVHCRGCVVCGDGPYGKLRDSYPSNRPDERRRRFLENAGCDRPDTAHDPPPCDGGD